MFTKLLFYLDGGERKFGWTQQEYWAKKTCSIQLSIVSTQENIEDTWCSNYTDIVFFLFLIDDFDLSYICGRG